MESLQQQKFNTFSNELKWFIEENLHYLIQIDDEGLIKSIHPFLCNLIGVPQSSCIGENIQNVQLSIDHLKSIQNNQHQVISTEEELMQNLEVLTKLNADKDKLIAILAHDLINHLNSILGFSALLKNNFRNFDADKNEKYIHIINHASKNAFNLFDDALKWIGYTNGLMNFNPKEHNLLNIFNEELLNFEDKITAKNIKICNEIELTDFVVCDLYMMKTVIRNLISNAIKFSYEGGEVHIAFTENRTHQFISISDKGIGISQEQINGIFDISENKSRPGTKKEKGTGLGLMICKEFIQKHHGTIKVQSEEGVGSEFKIVLPKKKFLEP